MALCKSAYYYYYFGCKTILHCHASFNINAVIFIVIIISSSKEIKVA